MQALPLGTMSYIIWSNENWIIHVNQLQKACMHERKRLSYEILKVNLWTMYIGLHVYRVIRSSPTKELINEF